LGGVINTVATYSVEISPLLSFILEKVTLDVRIGAYTKGKNRVPGIIKAIKQIKSYFSKK